MNNNHEYQIPTTRYSQCCVYYQSDNGAVRGVHLNLTATYELLAQQTLPEQPTHICAK